MSAAVPQAFSAALNVVGPALITYWNAVTAYNAAHTAANLNAAIAAATNAANVLAANLGAMPPGAQTILNGVNAVLAELQAIDTAAQAMMNL